MIGERKGREHNIKVHDNEDVDWIHVDQECLLSMVIIFGFHRRWEYLWSVYGLLESQEDISSMDLVGTYSCFPLLMWRLWRCNDCEFR